MSNSKAARMIRRSIMLEKRQRRYTKDNAVALGDMTVGVHEQVGSSLQFGLNMPSCDNERISCTSNLTLESRNYNPTSLENTGQSFLIKVMIYYFLQSFN